MTRFTRPDVDIEEQLLIGLITSDNFIKKILPVFEYDYLDMPTVAKMAKEIFKYHEAFGKAPGLHVQDIFDGMRKRLSEEEADWIRRFLVKLDSRAEKSGGFNEDYLFRNCLKYFGRQKLRKSAERVLDLLDNDRQDQAERVWLDSMSIPEAEGLGIDPFDPEIVKKIFERQEEGLQMSLGISSIDRMVGPVKSGWLVVFLGPEKRGKTWSLVHVAMRALFGGCNVVFISLEAADEKDMDSAMRFWKSMGSLSNRGPELDFPYFVDGDEVGYDRKKRPELKRKKVLENVKIFRRAISARFRLKTYPMGTGSMEDIGRYLDLLWVYENFSPHVVVVDYLGIIRAPGNIRETRDKYNYNSVALKALAQERRVIVFTGHQGVAASMEKMNLGPLDTSEDRRTLANVDVMYGLNQTEKEMDDGIMRVNVLVHRHRRFTRAKQAKVLQQLDVGQFVLDDRLIDRPASKNLKKGEGLKDAD